MSDRGQHVLHNSDRWQYLNEHANLRVSKTQIQSVAKERVEIKRMRQ